MSKHAFICDAVRTPIGRYGGALSSVRTDDLGAIPIRALMERNARVDWSLVDDVLYGCANQAGEDNRNVARMSSLLAGLPVAVPGGTINRLCGSRGILNRSQHIRNQSIAPVQPILDQCPGAFIKGIDRKTRVSRDDKVA